MRCSLFILALSASLFTGCARQPVPAPEQEFTVEHEKNLNRVHVRDDSALAQEETIGGAAFREQENSTQVLFNKHHQGEAVVHFGMKYRSANENAAGMTKPSKGTAPSTKAVKSKKKDRKDRSIYAK